MGTCPHHRPRPFHLGPGDPLITPSPHPNVTQTTLSHNHRGQLITLSRPLIDQSVISIVNYHFVALLVFLARIDSHEFVFVTVHSESVVLNYYTKLYMYNVL